MLVLVRHGRTAVNAQGRLQGRLDHPLDAVGQAQAVELAKTLTHVDRVVSSPLCRAQQTASVLSSTFELDERWTELDYGELDGLPTASVGVEVWDRWRVDSSFVPAGGESMTAMAARVAEACEDLREDTSRREVVVVSHVSPIKAAMAWALGTGPELVWRCHLDQASITRIAFTPRGVLLRSFNETGHLCNELSPPTISG